MIFGLFLIWLAVGPAMGLLDPNLKVRYDFSIDAFGETAFIEMPLYESDAVLKGFVEKSRPPSPSGLENLKLFCPADDYTVCVLYDDTRFVAGLQIAVEPDAFTNIEYDWETQGYTSWTTEINDVTKEYYTMQQYFMSGEFLQRNPVDRIVSRNSSILLQDGALWVTAFDGDLYEISTTPGAITGPNSIFTKQNCIQWMGTHYYYNMSAETECSAGTIFPWFPLVFDDQLIGIGYNIFAISIPGKGPVKLFEYSGDTAVKYTIPNGPQCLYDLSARVGQITMHTYFINAPYDVNCLAQIPA
ncbi:uncharacterized protein LOC113505412 [Trichoplusia ni]|uniref:Uncharacterized protein LOC113505412 n=1 Tax=Trichoplusia ni TaxID=7111 RepID=A0A7E5WUP7_TRINI|nr:uncharacterized protein LOC113505412 [Trichoplusia ni]